MRLPSAEHRDAIPLGHTGPRPKTRRRLVELRREDLPRPGHAGGHRGAGRAVTFSVISCGCGLRRLEQDFIEFMSKPNRTIMFRGQHLDVRLIKVSRQQMVGIILIGAFDLQHFLPSLARRFSTIAFVQTPDSLKHPTCRKRCRWYTFYIGIHWHPLRFS